MVTEEFSLPELDLDLENLLAALDVPNESTEEQLKLAIAKCQFALEGRVKDAYLKWGQELLSKLGPSPGNSYHFHLVQAYVAEVEAELSLNRVAEPKA